MIITTKGKSRLILWFVGRNKTVPFFPRNATNRLDKLVKELDKEVRIDWMPFQPCAWHDEVDLKSFHSHCLRLRLWLDEQQAEGRGLAEAAGEGASSAAAPERRQPAQGGDWIWQETQPGERMWAPGKCPIQTVGF